MASNKVQPTYKNLKHLISEAVEDVNSQLKALGFDLITADKEIAIRTINKIRQRIKQLDEKSKEMVTGLERGKQGIERQQRVAVKRQHDLTVHNEILAKQFNNWRTT